MKYVVLKNALSLLCIQLPEVTVISIWRIRQE
jgi:hypothetical protein